MDQGQDAFEFDQQEPMAVADPFPGVEEHAFRFPDDLADVICDPMHDQVQNHDQNQDAHMHIGQEIGPENEQFLQGPGIQPLLNDPINPMHAMNLISDDLFQGIIHPATPQEQAALVDVFRNEVWGDLVKDVMEGMGIEEMAPHDVHDMDMYRLYELIRLAHRWEHIPWIDREAIVRHDWLRRFDCIYRIRSDEVNIRGPAEKLHERYIGVQRALWEYWAHRTRVRQNHIRAYVHAGDPFDFFKVIMWHLLPTAEWLELWGLRDEPRDAARKGGESL